MFIKSVGSTTKGVCSNLVCNLKENFYIPFVLTTSGISSASYLEHNLRYNALHCLGELQHLELDEHALFVQ